MELRIDVTRVPVDAGEVARSARLILASNDLLALATVAPQGPHINTVYFVYDDDWSLYFLSEPDTVHCRNIAEGPRVAAAVYDSHQPWTNDKSGLQLFGDCDRVTGVRERHAFDLYLKRFPGLAQWVPTASAIETGMRSRFYELRILSMKVFDEATLGKENFVQATLIR